ncbi:multiple cyclophane-containing RiPP AmcA [Micromonospora sp. C28SCA-DRY-2]|uniref:multiple cyclophane-containing RiPP AmcA n=1 Tax=Micromonospora sp. C28SCA-DRY-2 TaxID=3059522 RepID=UPI002675EC5A|nr:multiple cyclophane-containing RiPP AmcA [Micromonospora sp. C28SCA-DRY-2]MDO3703966.1 multiple cyclophane-containing RiPP AmcA [Micromonospora sp. C28SCA-DRY-2]
MPETTSHRQPERVAGVAPDGVAERVREAAPGLTALLQEAENARRLRAEVAGGDGASAVCAWNHFENIPTFYNWNNRPR